MKKKVCIIKLGAPGDVLRTTPVLWNFKDCQVSWITEESCVSLLKNNPFIRKTLSIKEAEGLKGQYFDELYNFDEDVRACRLARELSAEKKKGFTCHNGSYFPFDADARYAFELSKNDDLKFRSNRKTYQQIIFETAGFKWRGQDYILGYRPRGRVKYAVGINYLVGAKFPNKAWPHWKQLQKMLENCSVQKEFPSLNGYIDWINSCRILVTGDSLGMHIALALKKKVIILMGSTSWNEIETYGRGLIIKPKLDCMPCYKKTKCRKKVFCMDLIQPGRVKAAIDRIS